MLAALGFLVAVAFWPGASYASIAPRWAAIAVGVPLLLLFTDAARLTAHHLVGLLFVAWALVTLAWTPNLYDATQASLQLVFLAATFALGARLADLRPIVTGIGAGLVIAAVVAVLQAAWIEHNAQIGGAFRVMDTWVWPRTDGIGSIFVNQGTYAEACALGIVAALTWRVWWAVPFGLVGIALTESRAAKVALIAALLLWTWERSRLAAGALLAAVIAAGLLLINYKHGSTVERWAIIQDAWAGITWLGNGIGSFQHVYPTLAERIDTFSFRVEHAHNDYFEVLFDLGCVGLLAAVALTAGAMFGPGRYVAVAFATLCALGFSSHLPLSGFVGALVLGHAARAWPELRVSLAAGRAALERRFHGTRRAARAGSGHLAAVAVGRQH